MSEWEAKIAILRKHFEAKGYRVHSGLQFGCELVLYADDPSKVHSDFCVHLVRDDDFLDWKQMQVLVRSMPDLHKTLILAKICYEDDTIDHTGERKAIVQELALATEHAPFRHKKHKIEVGGQIKPPK